MLLQLGYNWWIFGHPLFFSVPVGFVSHPLRVVANLLTDALSLEHGVFTFAAVLLWALAGISLLWRRSKGRFLLSILGSYVGFLMLVDPATAKAGSAYGPRYYLPVLPLLAFPLAHWLQSAHQQGRLNALRLFQTCLILNVLINAVGVLGREFMHAQPPWRILYFLTFPME